MGIRSVKQLTYLALLLTLWSCDQDIARVNLLVTNEQAIVISGTHLKFLSKFVDKVNGAESVGYCWSLSPGPTVADDTSKMSIDDEMSFEHIAGPLVEGSQYYVRAYCIDLKGNVSYGNQVTILNRFLPAFKGSRLMKITADFFEVESSFEVYANGMNFDSYGHIWSMTNEPQETDPVDEHANTQGLEPREVAINTHLEDLLPGQRYYLRTYVVSDGRRHYSGPLVIDVPLDLVIGTWTTVNFPLAHRFDYTVVEAGGDLYFPTGHKGRHEDRFTPDNTCFRLNLATNVLEEIAVLPGGPRHDTKSFSIDNKVYAGFGIQMKETEFPHPNRLYQYDASRNRWIPKATMPITGEVHFATSYQGFGYVGISASPEEAFGDDEFQIWKFDPIKNQWSQVLAELPLKEYEPLNDRWTVCDGKLYYESHYGLAKIGLTDGTLEQIPLPEMYVELVVLFNYQGNIYVSGVAGVSALSTTYKYDASGAKWIPRNDPVIYNTASGNFLTFNVGNEVYTGFYYMYTTSLYKKHILWFKYSE
jgi:hypothetical protein